MSKLRRQCFTALSIGQVCQSLAASPWVFAASVMVAISPALQAQEVVAGDTVRVTTPRLALEREIGRVLWLGADSLVFEASPDRWAVPVDLMTEFDVLRGYRGRAASGAPSAVPIPISLTR